MAAMKLFTISLVFISMVQSVRRTVSGMGVTSKAEAVNEFTQNQTSELHVLKQHMTLIMEEVKQLREELAESRKEIKNLKDVAGNQELAARTTTPNKKAWAFTPDGWKSGSFSAETHLFFVDHRQTNSWKPTFETPPSEFESNHGVKFTKVPSFREVLYKTGATDVYVSNVNAE
mmetsp:Transcript_28562/g.45972  ORF Transcript_28562/g.45972 Transcript_28562/m.45972 type:complete len:174 (-) Transcript_28562:61-582(-)